MNTMKQSVRHLMLCAALLAFATGAAAAEPSLDELLDIKPTKPTAPEAPKDSGDEAAELPAPQPAPGGEISPEVERILSGKEAGDVLVEALTEMKDASERLGGELDPGVRTQRIQLSALTKLDRVIASAEQQQGQSSSSQQQPKDPRDADRGGQPQPGQPKPGQPKPGSQQGEPSESSSPGNTAGQAPMGDRSVNAPDRELTGQGSEWGNLPARLRDQLLEGQNEKFSPIYRELTEQYYKRLAEEKR